MVRFVLRHGPFCPGHGSFCPWSVLSMVRYVLNSYIQGVVGLSDLLGRSVINEPWSREEGHIC